MAGDGESSSSQASAHYVSTGSLPPREDVQRLVDAAYTAIRGNREGAVSDVYPALGEMPPDLFGICVTGVPGSAFPAGDADHPFTIMSVSKPFVFAIVCEALGPARAHAELGANATGLPFNSIEAIERTPDGRTNPMVNPGAIAATGLVPGDTPEAKWRAIRSALSRFAGRDLEVHDGVYASAMRSNERNRAIVEMLQRHGRIGAGGADALDLYTRQCALTVTARDLSVMGATLADGGVNPVTGERVIDAETCHYTLAVMTTAGLYETSGDWLYDIGLPAKSGIGGGIVMVSPGKGGLGTFAPRLDREGNSVKGRLTARALSRSLGLDLFASSPARPDPRGRTGGIE